MKTVTTIDELAAVLEAEGEAEFEPSVLMGEASEDELGETELEAVSGGACYWLRRLLCKIVTQKTTGKKCYCKVNKDNGTIDCYDKKTGELLEYYYY